MSYDLGVLVEKNLGSVFLSVVAGKKTDSLPLIVPVIECHFRCFETNARVSG